MATFQSYSGRSLHSTATRGATANFTFNGNSLLFFFYWKIVLYLITGTGVKFFGAYRPGYGAYTLTVDGVEVANGNAESATLNVRQTLGAVSGLEYGEHTAVLTAVGDGTIDLDWIEMETRVGPDGYVVDPKSLNQPYKLKPSAAPRYPQKQLMTAIHAFRIYLQARAGL